MKFSYPLSPASFHEINSLITTAWNDIEMPSTIQVIDSCSDTAQLPPIRRIRYYQRQQHEKEALQQEIAQLTYDLHQQKVRKKARNNSNSTSPRRISPWKAIARHRLQQSLAAEAQRTWLKAAIKGEIALADDLKAVVRQHMKIASLVAASSPDQSAALFLQPTDELLYAMDMQDVESQYRQTDAVFSTCGLDLSSESEDFRRTVTTGENGVSIQYVWKQCLMFSFEQTCVATWMLGHHLHRQEDREVFEGNDDPDNLLRVKFRIKNQRLGSGRTSVLQRYVMRRFIEEGRMVITWRSFVAGEGRCRGMQTDDVGWTVVQPSPSGLGTIVEVVMKQEPLHLNSASAVPTMVMKHFDEMLQIMVQENSKEVLGGAESLLLEDAMGGINLSPFEIFNCYESDPL